jgi:hypothetical protein
VASSDKNPAIPLLNQNCHNQTSSDRGQNGVKPWLGTIAVLMGLTPLACADDPSAGTWRVVAINGARVPPSPMRVVIENGRVTGGHDGCNAWGRDQTSPGMIVTDLRECTRTATAEAYVRIVMPEARPRLDRDGRNLRVKRGVETMILEPVGSS